MPALLQPSGQLSSLPCRVAAGSRRPLALVRGAFGSVAVPTDSSSRNHVVRTPLEPLRAAAVSVFGCNDIFAVDPGA